MELLTARAEKHTRVTSGRGHVKIPPLIVLHVQKNPIQDFTYTCPVYEDQTLFSSATVICDKQQVYTRLNEILELNLRLLRC